MSTIKLTTALDVAAFIEKRAEEYITEHASEEHDTGAVVFLNINNINSRECVMTIKNMQRFIGTKMVAAQPMTRAAYNLYRGWVLPENENGADEGYLVEYLDGTGKPNDARHVGYISWSPADHFAASYRAYGQLTFGMALEAMKKGLRVARNGWNGQGMWIAIGSGKKSLNADQFWNPHAQAFAITNGGSADVQAYFVMKTAQGDIQMGWSPTQSDCLTEDWIIV